MHIPEIEIGSVGQLVAEVMTLSTACSPVWFRGQADSSWKLDPKVLRNARDFSADQTYETNLVHRFRGRAPLLGADTGPNREAAWLQTMQHHKLPTRLLDWSRSPLVAAYFAIENAIVGAEGERTQAVIWCLYPHKLNGLSTGGQIEFTPSIESGIARSLTEGAFYGDDSSRKSAHARWSAWQSTLSAEDPQKLANESSPDHLAVMAYESDVRMLVQQGAFTVHSFGSDPLDDTDWASSILRKLVIPSARVADLANEIEACGLGEAGIYPDLDHLSAELERAGKRVGTRP